MDWLHDAVGYVLAGVGAAVLGLVGWLSTITLIVMQRAEKLAKLEERIDGMPSQLADIRNTLELMRREAGERAAGIYTHVDAVRRELMDEIKDGDRRT